MLQALVLNRIICLVFFAARKDGWYHINVLWNYQLHHVPYSLERLLEWYKFLQDGGIEITDAHR